VIAPLVAQRMGLMTMGTFHQRRGDQSFLTGVGALVYSGPGAQGDASEGDGDGPPPGVWGRVFGANSDLGTNATLSIAGYDVGPQFDGNYWGIQVGSDLYEIEHDNGHTERFGLFYTHANTDGDISGNIFGQINLSAGTLDLSEDSVAAYWTHLSPEGWYVDVIAKYGWLNGTSRSNRGIESDVDGTSFAMSAETGLPFAIAEGWTIEPQAQIIWQRIDFDDTSDRFSKISNEAFDSFTGRIGARVQYSSGPAYGHLGLNLWHGFSADQTVTFNTFPLVTQTEGTWLEVNLGGAYEISENVSAFGDLSYSFDVDGAESNMFGGQVGLRFKW